MADNEHPQRRDLEPRATPPPGPPNPGPVDPQQLAQFEQFQQFQQFLKFQETQGGAAPQLPPAKKRLWKQILFSKGFRKLLLAIVVVIGIVWAYNHYFGPPPDDGLGVKGSAGPGQKTDPNRLSGTPGAAVDSLYRYAARPKQLELGPDKKDFAASACELFSDTGKADFVRDFGGTDCPTILRGLDGKVATLQVLPTFDITGKTSIDISSCRDLRLKPDTTGLGEFTVSRLSDGWIISGHQSEPDPCPASATTGSAPPTSN